MTPEQVDSVLEAANQVVTALEGLKRHEDAVAALAVVLDAVLLTERDKTRRLLLWKTFRATIERGGNYEGVRA